MKPTYGQLLKALHDLVRATPSDRPLLVAQAHDLLRLVEPLPANAVLGCPLPESVQALALSGRKLDAIRLLRTDYGIGLLLAKDAIEAFIATENLRREARLLAPAAATCGTCHLRDANGSCRRDVLDPEGDTIDDAPIHNWRNRSTFGCTEWRATEPTR